MDLPCQWEVCVHSLCSHKHTRERTSRHFHFLPHILPKKTLHMSLFPCEVESFSSPSHCTSTVKKNHQHMIYIRIGGPYPQKQIRLFIDMCLNLFQSKCWPCSKWDTHCKSHRLDNHNHPTLH